MQKQIIYIGDPMCSWCYGFTKVIQRICKDFKDRATTTLVMGGLRPDGTHVVDDSYRNFLREHWSEIGERTKQPFDLSILNTTGWIYDTEKACRAVVVMRLLKPEAEWEFFAAAQEGFYHYNHNPNSPESFARIAEGFDIGQEAFLEAYRDEKIIRATKADFEWARSVGVNSFPTVLVRDDRGIRPLTIGYRPFEQLVGPLESWLNS